MQYTSTFTSHTTAAQLTELGAACFSDCELLKTSVNSRSLNTAAGRERRAGHSRTSNFLRIKSLGKKSTGLEILQEAASHSPPLPGSHTLALLLLRLHPCWNTLAHSSPRSLIFEASVVVPLAPESLFPFPKVWLSPLVAPPVSYRSAPYSPQHGSSH